MAKKVRIVIASLGMLVFAVVYLAISDSHRNGIKVPSDPTQKALSFMSEYLTFKDEHNLGRFMRVVDEYVDYEKEGAKLYSKLLSEPYRNENVESSLLSVSSVQTNSTSFNKDEYFILKENYEFDQTDPDCIISFGTYTRIFKGKFEFTYDFVLIEKDRKYVEMYEKQN